MFAIRFFENALQEKSFGNLTVADVGRGRDTLKASLEARGPESRSKSTVAHIASHVSDFLVWLTKQEGFRRLPQDLPDYLKLPKAAYAKAKTQPVRKYAALEEAAAMLQSMPKRTLIDRRSRAIFAIAYLGALRADTLISLHLCHVDLENRVIIQDADVVRAKNGKSLGIFWFPAPPCFAAEVEAWAYTLRDLGLKPDDALFPEARTLTVPERLHAPDRRPITCMASTFAVTAAFKSASRTAENNYTPHSARHTIASERNRLPLTQLQRRAWSQNMGHENDQTTERNYGKISEEERGELMRQGTRIASGGIPAFSDEQKILMFDRFLAEVVNG